jgi:hypothetical protein
MTKLAQLRRGMSGSALCHATATLASKIELDIWNLD